MWMSRLAEVAVVMVTAWQAVLVAVRCCVDERCIHIPAVSWCADMTVSTTFTQVRRVHAVVWWPTMSTACWI